MSDDSVSAGVDEDTDDALAGVRPAPLRWFWIVGGILLAALLGLVFVGYRQPELLIEAVNLRYCS